MTLVRWNHAIFVVYFLAVLYRPQYILAKQERKSFWYNFIHQDNGKLQIKHHTASIIVYSDIIASKILCKQEQTTKLN